MDISAPYPPEVTFNHPDGVTISSGNQTTGSLKGRFALVSNTGDSNVAHVDLASGTVENSYGGFAYPAGLALSPDDTFALVCDPSNHRIGHIDMYTSEVTWPYTDADGFNQPYGVAIAPDGTFALVANYGENNIGHIDFETNKVTFPYGGVSGKDGAVPSALSQPRDVAFSPDAAFALVANEGGGNIAKIDLTVSIATPKTKGKAKNKQKNKNSMISFLDLEFQDPHGVAIAADGTLFVTAAGSRDSSHVTRVDLPAIEAGGIAAMAVQQISGFNEAYSVAIAGDGLFALVCDYGDNHLCMVELDETTPVSDKVMPPEPEIPKTHEEIVAEKMEAWTEEKRLEKEERLKYEQRRLEELAARAERKSRSELRAEVRGRVENVGNADASSVGPIIPVEGLMGGGTSASSPSIKGWEMQYDALQGWRRKPTKTGEHEAYSMSLQRSAEQLVADVSNLREVFDRASPVAPGISIPEAWRRMSRLEDSFAQIDKVNDMVEAGERKLLGEGGHVCEERLVDLEDLRQRIDACKHLFDLGRAVANTIVDTTTFAAGSERKIVHSAPRSGIVLTLSDSSGGNEKEYSLLPSGRLMQLSGRHYFDLEQRPPPEVYVIPPKEAISAYSIQEVEEPTAVVALCHVPPVLVYGALGVHKSKINGIYLPTGVVVNKREQLQKRKVTPHDLDIVMSFSSSAQWEIICTEPEVLEVDSEDEDEVSATASGSGSVGSGSPARSPKSASVPQVQYTGNMLTNVLCQSVDADLMNPCDSRGGWKLMLGPKGKLSDDPIAGVIMAPHVAPVLITGVQGAAAAKVNGVFKPTGIVQNGKPLLVKMEGDTKVSWLRFVAGSRNAWMVSGLSDKNANGMGGYLICRGPETHLVDDPARCGDGLSWCVLSQDDKNSTVQGQGVKVARHVNAVLLAGATGLNAQKINGAFEPTGEAQNGFEVLQKKEDPDMWLRYDTAGNWTVSNNSDKDANNGNCVCFATKQGVFDPIESKVWKVYDGSGSFERQAIAVTRPMPLVVVQGCTGSYASKINGVYHPTGEIYNGKELLVQYYDPNIFLRFVTQGNRNTWYISKGSDKDANNAKGYCWCSEIDVDSPLEPHPVTGEAVEWCVLGAKNPDVADPNITAEEYLDPPPQLNSVVFEKCTTVPYYKIINGTYKPTGLNYNGKELFRKVPVKVGDPDIWLHYQNRDKCNDWRVTELLGSEQFERCVSKEKGLDSPAHAKKWLCKTEYQSGGYEEGNAKMVCRYIELKGDKKKKALADAMRRRLGGNRPLGVDRSASKMQEASGGRAIHDIAVTRDQKHIAVCEFIPGGIYEGTKHDSSGMWQQMLEKLNIIEAQAMLPANQGKPSSKRRKGGGCSNFRTPPIGDGSGTPLSSEERQDLSETFDQNRQACSNSFVAVYSHVRHSSVAEKRVLHFESPGKAIQFKACAFSGDNEYLAAVADNLLVLWDWAQKTPEGGWTSKMLLQTKTNSGSEKLQQELRSKTRVLNELTDKVDYLAGKMDTAQKELDALEEAVAEAEAVGAQITKEVAGIKSVISMNETKAKAEIAKLHMDYMGEFRRPLNGGGSLPPPHKGLVKVLILLLKTEDEKVEEKAKNDELIAKGEEPKVEPSDKDMAVFLGNAANLKTRCEEFKMTLNKFEVIACDGMMKALSPENDFERDMKVKSASPGDRIQMESCKRASEEARKLACWVRGNLEVSMQGEALKAKKEELAKSNKATDRARTVAETSPQNKNLENWKGDMHRLEAKHGEAEEAVEAVNQELEVQTEDVNKVAFNPSDRTCITTSGAALKQWTVNVPKRQFVPRDLKVEGLICDHVWLNRTSESEGDGERLVALARVESGSYNLSLFTLARGRLEYAGSNRGVYEATMKSDVYRDLIIPMGGGYVAAHMHQHIQLGRSQTSFAYSRNGKTLDWSLRVTTPGVIIFESVAARPNENMVIAHSANGEIYFVRLDDIVSEDNKDGAIDIDGKKLHLRRMERPYFRPAEVKPEGGRVNGADEVVDVASAGAGHPADKFQMLLDQVNSLGEFYDEMISEGLINNVLKSEILSSPMCALIAHSASRLADQHGTYPEQLMFLELIHSYVEYWHQPSCTWTDFRWDHRRLWHLSFMDSKILTARVEEFDNLQTMEMLAIVDELLARKSGSALVAFRSQLGCLLKSGDGGGTDGDNDDDDEGEANTRRKAVKTELGVILQILREFSNEGFVEDAKLLVGLNPWDVLREAFSIQRELNELKVRDLFELDWRSAVNDSGRAQLITILQAVMNKVRGYRRKLEMEAVGSFPELIYQSESGNCEALKKLLSTKSKSLTCTDEDGRNLLHLAVRHGQTHVVAMLLQEANAPVNRANKNGETPLHQACRYGRINIIRYLLDHGAGVNLGSGEGNTPLHIAAVQNKRDVALLLLEFGAVMDVRNGWVASLQTPGDLADNLGYTGMSQLLHQFVAAGAANTDERIMEDAKAVELENDVAHGPGSTDPQALVVPLSKQTRSLAQSTGGVLHLGMGAQMFVPEGGIATSVADVELVCLDARVAPRLPKLSKEDKELVGLNPVYRFRSSSRLTKQCTIEFPVGGDPLLVKACGDSGAPSAASEGSQQLVLWRRRQANAKWEIVPKSEYSARYGRVQMHLGGELPYQITTSFEHAKQPLRNETAVANNQTAVQPGAKQEVSLLCFTDPKPPGNDSEALFVVWAVPKEPMARMAVLSKMVKQHPSALHLCAESSERLMLGKKAKITMKVGNQAPISKVFTSGSCCRFDVPDPGLSPHKLSVPVTIFDAARPSENKATVVLRYPRPLAPPFPPTVVELASTDGKPFTTVALTRPLENVTYDIRYKVLASSAILDPIDAAGNVSLALSRDDEWKTAWSMRDDNRLDHLGKFTGNQYIIPTVSDPMEHPRSPIPKSELGSPFGAKSRASDLGKITEESDDDKTLTDYAYVGTFFVQARAINAFGLTPWSDSCFIGRQSAVDDPALIGTSVEGNNAPVIAEDSSIEAQKIIDRCMLLAQTARVYPSCASTLLAQLVSIYQRCQYTATRAVNETLQLTEDLLKRCSTKGWLLHVLIPPSPSWVHDFKKLGRKLYTFEVQSFATSKMGGDEGETIDATSVNSAPSVMPSYLTNFMECPQWNGFARQHLVATIIQLGAQHGSDVNSIIDVLESQAAELALNFSVDEHEMDEELQNPALHAAIQALTSWMHNMHSAPSPRGGAIGIVRSSSTGSLPASPSHHGNNHREKKSDHHSDLRSRGDSSDGGSVGKPLRRLTSIAGRRTTNARDIGSPKKGTKRTRSKAAVYLSGVLSTDGELAGTFLEKIKAALFERGIRVFTSYDALTVKTGKREPFKQRKLDYVDEAILQCSMFVPIITSSYGNELGAKYTNREFMAATRFGKRIIPILRLGAKEEPEPSLRLRLAGIGPGQSIEAPPPPPPPPSSPKARHRQPVVVQEAYDEAGIFSSALEGILSWAATLNIQPEAEPIEDPIALAAAAAAAKAAAQPMELERQRSRSRAESNESDVPEDGSLGTEESSEAMAERLAREKEAKQLEEMKALLEKQGLLQAGVALELMGIKSLEDLDRRAPSDDDLNELALNNYSMRTLLKEVRGAAKPRWRRAITYRALPKYSSSMGARLRAERYSSFGILNSLCTPLNVSSNGDLAEGSSATGPVILIDARWLSKFAKGELKDSNEEGQETEQGTTGGSSNALPVLPRRQDIERDYPDAIYTGPLYENVTVLVLSCCWVDRCHCDPSGHQLRDICKVLDWYIGDAKRTGRDGVAVFWDFMSLFQHDVDYSHARVVSLGKREMMVDSDSPSDIKKWNITVRFDDSDDHEPMVVPHHLIRESIESQDVNAAEKALHEGRMIMVRKPRSRDEDRLFALAMKEMDVWYSSKCTTKLLMTYLPDSVLATDMRPEHSDSGWPTFERFAADFLSDNASIIDVGKLKYDNHHWEELRELKRQASSFSRGRMSFKHFDDSSSGGGGSGNTSAPETPSQRRSVNVPEHAARSMAAYEMKQVEKVVRDFNKFAFARLVMMHDRQDLANAGKFNRSLPIVPESFKEMVDRKTVAIASDRLFLKKKYDALYQDIVVQARRFKLDNCSVPSASWRTFVDSVLKAKEEVTYLNLCDNPALDLPLEDLVALDCLKSAKILLINETSLSGSIHLLGQLPELEVLDISGCPKLFGVAEDGAQIPMTDKVAFQECVKSLKEVLLGRCRITWETPAKDVKTILKSSVRKISSIRRAASRRSLKKNSLLSPSSKSPSSTKSPSSPARSLSP